MDTINPNDWIHCYAIRINLLESWLNYTTKNNSVEITDAHGDIVAIIDLITQP